MQLTFLPSGLAPYLLSALRIITALLFVEHGTAKLFHWPHLAMFDQVALDSLPGIAGYMEIVGGAFLALGLFTRPVAFILSGEMAFAYFLAHAPQSFFPLLNGGEGAILFCFIFLYLAAAEPGPLSVDSMLKSPNAAAARA